MNTLMQSTTLSNGIKMPWLGFGTFKIADGIEAVEAVKEALKIGYRHIDTATIYGNEASVGLAIKESGVPREDIFLTTKVWNSDQGYDSTLKAFETSLNKLGTDYVDLYLIHWPKALNKETWKALEHLYKQGKVKAIGVANFKIHHLEEILSIAEILPMVNQVELHPQYPQEELHAFCKKHNIQLEAWGSLMQGKIFDLPVIGEIANKYNKSVAQVALRWAYQQGIVCIPKSISPDRIKANTEIFDFELSAQDMTVIAGLNTDKRIGPDPDLITF